MKKILFVAPSVRYGGAAKNFIGIANYAVQKGYEVHLLTEVGKEPMRYINPTIVRHYSNVENERNVIMRWISCIREVRRVLKEIHPDVTISFIEPWRSACVLASKFTKSKCIVSERADPYSRGKRHDKFIFSIFSMADGFVFQTEQAKQYFNRKVQRRGVVIPNPVFEDDIFLPYEGPKKDVIVSVARLDLIQKRQDVLISAFEKIADKYPTYVLHLYGDGKDAEKIRSLADKTLCKDRIKLCGVTTDIRTAVGEAKVMALSSDFEGIPNAIIESMCIGVPVVSTKCSPGGAELLISNEIDGLLVECGDVDAMATAIDKILSNKEFSGELVQNAFAVRDRFMEGDLLKKWIVYIEEIMS